MARKKSTPVTGGIELGRPTAFIIGATNLEIYRRKEVLETMLLRKFKVFFRETIRFVGKRSGVYMGCFPGEDCYRYTVFVAEVQARDLLRYVLRLTGEIGGQAYFEHAGVVTLLNARKSDKAR